MVFREDPEDEPEDSNYVVAEGNRRLCALKLLKDPKRAPSHMRDAFKRYAAGFKPPRSIEVVIEEDEDERRKWIERAHAGTLGGKGRKAWNTNQKTRHFRNRRNLRGQALLDYAVALDFIPENETQGRLSHLVRLIGNPVMRSVIGIHYGEEPEQLYRDRPRADFEKLITCLMEEALAKHLGSQASRETINSKAFSLESELDCNLGRLPELVLLNDDIMAKDSEHDDGSREEPDDGGTGTTGDSPEDGGSTEPDEDKADAGGSKDESPPKPERPEPSKVMPYSKEVEQHLKKLGNYKLESLYYSISTIWVRDNVPTLYVASWSLLDSLSVALGRPVTKNISDHWQRKNLLSRQLGYTGDTANSVADAFTRIRRQGNDTKHHPTSAGFDAEQLKSDWKLILPVLEYDLEEYFKDGQN